MSEPTLPVIVMGPVNAGKSTISLLLAKRLGVPSCSLDTVCWDYYLEQGFDQGGYDAEWAYMRQFYPRAIERVIAEHGDQIIDLGAGHTVYDEPHRFAPVQQVVAPHPHVVLLLPSPDPDESVEILKQRHSNPRPVVVARNEHVVRHGSNAALATITVFTQGRTPDKTCEQIIAQLT
jgi:shikimate kinase